jgi:hypothetical protein
MPLPGTSNNGLGINSFSGPMGEKEAPYGLTERLKVLSKIGVKPPPSVNAGKQSQRRATSKTKGAPQEAPPPPAIAGAQAPIASYDQELVNFWQQMAATPGASPLILQIANEVAG